MENERSREILVGSFWIGWRRWFARAFCLSAIVSLGMLRTATDAEFTFASLALLPVLAIGWVDGKRIGVLFAFLAATMWGISDFVAANRFSAPWIPWTNAAIRLITYTLAALFAAHARSQISRERERAILDSLTGLHNRRAFLEVGVAEVNRAKRYKHPLAVIFIDLDNFKSLNDTMGHDAGDAALRMTAEALGGSLRASDCVARLGGDEFAVLLPEVAFDSAVETGRKLSFAVNAALDSFAPVKCSLGVAWFSGTDHSFTDMVKAADKLMYEAKAGGKNAIHSQQFRA